MSRACVCGVQVMDSPIGGRWRTKKISNVPNTASFVHAGLVSIMAAKAFGADRIAVAELSESNLIAAREVGADACVHTAPGEGAEEVGERVRQALAPHRADVVIDCAGFEATTQVVAAVTGCFRQCHVGSNSPATGNWCMKPPQAGGNIIPEQPLQLPRTLTCVRRERAT